MSRSTGPEISWPVLSRGAWGGGNGRCLETVGWEGSGQECEQREQGVRTNSGTSRSVDAGVEAGGGRWSGALAGSHWREGQGLRNGFWGWNVTLSPSTQAEGNGVGTGVPAPTLQARPLCLRGWRSYRENWALGLLWVLQPFYLRLRSSFQKRARSAYMCLQNQGPSVTRLRMLSVPFLPPCRAAEGRLPPLSETLGLFICAMGITRPLLAMARGVAPGGPVWASGRSRQGPRGGLCIGEGGHFGGTWVGGGWGGWIRSS